MSLKDDRVKMEWQEANGAVKYEYLELGPEVLQKQDIVYRKPALKRKLNQKMKKEPSDGDSTPHSNNRTSALKVTKKGSLLRRPAPGKKPSSPILERSEECSPEALEEPPSPAMYFECGASTPKSKKSARKKPTCLPRRPSKDAKIHSVINYGSESDSDADCGEDDELPTSLCIPRVDRIVIETPEDDEEIPSPPVAALLSSPETPHSSPQTCPDQPSWISDPLFNFEWHSFPNPPTLPEVRREVFSETNCGPTTPCVDPYDIFVSIWDQSVMETIATETNKYAQQCVTQMMGENRLAPSSRICQWKDTSPEELYIYFGMLLATGVVVKSRLREYWSRNGQIFDTPGFSQHLSLRRFELLTKCLHFKDNRDLHAQNLTPSEAKLFKIAPLVSHLNEKFQALYKMRQNIAFDESLLQSKGWLQSKKFRPNKTAVGIKSYEICESQTGYLWRFEIQAHDARPESMTRHPLQGTTTALVLRLIQGLEHKGHTIWMDNLYNSPILARQLKRSGMDCAGTLRTNRLFVPEEISKLKKGQMVEGQVTGVTSGDVDIMVWRDWNRVATISTYHGNAVSTDTEGKTKPILIRDYNTMMGGLDKKDRFLSAYPIERKQTRIWYKNLFRRLLNVSVLNAYIIHKQSASDTKYSNTDRLTHRTFRMSLINRLLHHRKARPPSAIPAKEFDVRVHYPCENPFLPSGTARLRRVCVVCGKRTPAYCAGCMKAACVFTCFRVLHK